MRDRSWLTFEFDGDANGKSALTDSAKIHRWNVKERDSDGKVHRATGQDVAQEMEEN